MGEVVIFPRLPPRFRTVNVRQVSFWVGLLDGLPPKRQKEIVVDAWAVGLISQADGDRLVQWFDLESA